MLPHFPDAEVEGRGAVTQLVSSVLHHRSAPAGGCGTHGSESEEGYSLEVSRPGVPQGLFLPVPLGF